MKVFPPLLILLLALAIHAEGQSVKQLERKVKKTYNRGAYSMSLYYSQALLKLNSDHPDALEWSKRANKELNMYSQSMSIPDGAPAITYAIAFPTKREKAVPAVPKRTLIVSTYNASDSSTLKGTYIGITNDGFGTGRFHQNENNENKAVFEIADTLFYTITATKDMFNANFATWIPKSPIVDDTCHADIYLKPAWNLPLTLYFDHEKPSAGAAPDSTTSLTYEDTWVNYLYCINDYIDNSTADKATAQIEVSRFFKNHIDAGYHHLEHLCKQLENHLKTGKSISLVLEANTGEHSDALLKRRFNSIENYFSFYKGEIFKPWMMSGKLKIVRQVLPSTISSSEAATPFDLKTAQERKVVIKIMEQKKSDELPF